MFLSLNRVCEALALTYVRMCWRMQYIKTIGYLEPSHVIRQFLDSQRINNLTLYLQALHDNHLADKHHTTLLLNCYTKVLPPSLLFSCTQGDLSNHRDQHILCDLMYVQLKSEQHLDEFVDKQMNFDVETAIRVSTTCPIPAAY